MGIDVLLFCCVNLSYKNYNIIIENRKNNIFWPFFQLFFSYIPSTWYPHDTSSASKYTIENPLISFIIINAERKNE
jgi:hypothetical protein